jgi:hypothetical protein
MSEGNGESETHEFTYQKVAEDSPLLREIRQPPEEQESKNTESQYIFGLPVLDRLQELRESPSTDEVTVNEERNKLFLPLREILNERSKTGPPGTIRGSKFRSEQIKRNPAFEARWREILANTRRITPPNLFIDPKYISDDLFESMLEVHAKRFIEEDIPEFEALELKFRDELLHIVASFGEDLYPDDGVMQEMLQRIRSTKAKLTDELIFRHEYIFGTQIQGDQGELEVLFSPRILPSRKENNSDLLWKVYVHEMTHAMGGMVHVVKMNKASKEYTYLPSKRSGLIFSKRFKWLNEAVTEHVTDRILGEPNDETKGYYDFRTLLDVFRTAGKQEIPMQDITYAYFENHPGSGGELVYWKRFMESVTSAYGPRFLPKLELYIERHGIEAATKIVQTDWQKILEDEQR